MCARFLAAATNVLNNETILLPLQPSTGTALHYGEYGDSHGLNGALQAVAVRWSCLLVLRCVQYPSTT